VGIPAAGAGAPQRPEKVQRIYSAGAAFGVARAERVSDVHQKPSKGRDPYIATVVVQLPVKADGEPVTATVKTTTWEPPRPGDSVHVLYAPAHPQLGAVAGGERSLGWKLRGEAMSALARWCFIAFWVLGAVTAVVALTSKHGIRAFSHLGRKDKAIRGTYTRVGGHFDREGSGKYLEIRTEAGWAHFYTNISVPHLPEVMVGQHLWLCWDANRGARKSRFSPRKTPAALVFDTGLVVHGMMIVEKTRSLNGSATSVEKLGQEDRPLRLYDPFSRWPAFTDPLCSQVFVVVIACAVLLTFDVSYGWRWAAAIIGFLGAATAAGGCLNPNDDSDAKRAAV
jgi:hypothetical protein